MEIEIDPPSAAQMRKLHLGHPFRARLGSGLKLHVPVSVGKKMMKASMKGMGATVDSCSCMGCGMCGGSLPARTPRGIDASYTPPPAPPPLGGNVKSSAKKDAIRLMDAGTDRAVRALEGSGMAGMGKSHKERQQEQLRKQFRYEENHDIFGRRTNRDSVRRNQPPPVYTYRDSKGHVITKEQYDASYGNRPKPPPPRGGNVKSSAKKDAIRLMDAGTDRAVRALEGSGQRDAVNPFLNPQARGGNVKSSAKKDSIRLMDAGTDRAVRALEGSGLENKARLVGISRMGGAVNPFVQQKKQQEKKQDQQKDELMKQMDAQMKKQSSIMQKAKKAQKTQSATVNKELMQQVTQQVRKTKQLMSKAADLHEEAVDDAKTDFREQMRQQAKHMPTVGGKVNRRKKFDGWFKSIGSKFKTLNHNLAPVKKAATNRAVTEITYRNNPTAQAKALLDMAQEEFGDDDEAAVAPAATSQMMSHGVSPQMLSQAVASKSFAKIKKVKAPKMKKIKVAEAQPMDINGDGEADGFFYPREMSYFGAGMGQMNPVPPHAYRPNRSRGKGVGEMGRPTIMPVMPPYRNVPVRSGMGAKKSSPWIEHVKAYAAQHNLKYGEALKRAGASYKKGGALYPAGYDPYNQM